MKRCSGTITITTPRRLESPSGPVARLNSGVFESSPASALDTLLARCWAYWGQLAERAWERFWPDVRWESRMQRKTYDERKSRGKTQHCPLRTLILDFAMCYFITIGIPYDKTEFLENHVPRELHVSTVANETVLRHMGPGVRTYLLASGGCSCDLFSEPRGANENGGDAELKRLRRKYERQGWSAAKIERALSQHTAGSDETAQLVSGLRGDVQRFLGELAESVGRVAVLVHWYEGDVEEAAFACRAGGIVSAEVAREERLRVGSDEIVWVGGKR